MLQPEASTTTHEWTIEISKQRHLPQHEKTNTMHDAILYS